MVWRLHLASFALLVLLSLGLPRRACAAPGSPPSFTLEFEDMFGSCGDNASVNGPGNVTYQGVNFATPDILTTNFGKGIPDPPELHTSFTSDWFAFFCYDGGTTITFPQPISALSFKAGTRDAYVGSMFKLFRGSTELATFSDAYPTLHPVAASFSTPVTSVNIKWVDNSGPTSLVGIDTLTYTLVPEPAGPAGGIVLLAGGIMVCGRRHHAGRRAANGLS
jgi:hypothetical protein